MLEKKLYHGHTFTHKRQNTRYQQQNRSVPLSMAFSFKYIEFDLSRSVLTTACPTSRNTSRLACSRDRGAAHQSLEWVCRRWFNQCVFWLDRMCCYHRVCCYQSCLRSLFRRRLEELELVSCAHHVHLCTLRICLLPASTAAACHFCHYRSPCANKNSEVARRHPK